MKRFAALILALCLLLALAACDGASLTTPSLKLDDLVGKWQTTYTLEEDVAEELLDYYGFTEEERALIGHDVFKVAQILTIGSDKTYSFEIDGERSRNLVRQSFNSIISLVYDHLGELTDTYGEEMAEEVADLDEFKDYYAWMYDFDSYDEYLDAVVEDFVSEYYDMSSPIDLEHGTFTIDGTDLVMTIDGESEGASVGASLSGNSLLITYKDGEELYTRLGN